MAFTLIITSILISVLILVILWKVTKALFKTIFFFFIITTIIAAIFGLLVWRDFQNLSEAVKEKSILVIMHDNNKLVSTVEINPSEDNQATELSKEDYNNIKNEFNKGQNLKNILDPYAFIFIVDTNILELAPRTEVIIDENTKIPKNKAIGAIKSEKPIEFLELDNIQSGNNVFKLYLLSSLISGSGEDVQLLDSSIFFLEQFKQGNLYIYKETIIFKFIKIIPTSIIEAQLKKTL